MSPPTSEDLKPKDLTSLEHALLQSLLSPDVRDVHIYAFSRRTHRTDGTVEIGESKPILAIGSILKDKSEHFSKRESVFPPY